MTHNNLNVKQVPVQVNKPIDKLYQWDVKDLRNNILDFKQLKLLNIYKDLCKVTSNQRLRDFFWFNHLKVYRLIDKERLQDGVWSDDGIHAVVISNCNILVGNRDVSIRISERHSQCDIFKNDDASDITIDDIKNGIIPSLKLIMYLCNLSYDVPIETPVFEDVVLADDVLVKEDVDNKPVNSDNVSYSARVSPSNYFVSGLDGNAGVLHAHAPKRPSRKRKGTPKSINTVRDILRKHARQPESLYNALNYGPFDIVNAMSNLGLSKWEAANGVTIFRVPKREVMVVTRDWYVIMSNDSEKIFDELRYFDGRSARAKDDILMVLHALTELVDSAN